jgi:thioredoxin 1
MASDKIHVFNDVNFDTEVLGAGVPVLVDFTATWCGPCKALSPIVDQIANELDGKVKVGKLDVDDSPLTAGKYGVRGVPTVMVFKGGEKKAQHVVVTNKDTLVKMLET